LLQFGAQQVQKLGVWSQAAFEEYQRTGDPKHLKNATQLLEQAWHYVPDASTLRINVDPRSRQMTATFTDRDGKAKSQVVSPQQIPALIAGMQNGSVYWQSIAAVGDPAGTARREQHAYTEREHAATRAETRARDDEKFVRSQSEWDRRHAATVADRPVKPPVDVPDNPAILNARADADSRRADLKAAENASTAEDFTTDPKVIAARERYDQAASALYRALPPASRDLTMGRMGHAKFSYRSAAADAPATAPDAPRVPSSFAFESAGLATVVDTDHGGSKRIVGRFAATGGCRAGSARQRLPG
jgi:hypothetical protein